MNVLITGVDGFVGSHLAEALLEAPGNRLFGTVRRPSHVLPLLGTRVTRIQIDITDAEAIHRAVHDVRPGKIFHVAGQAFVPTSFENPSETFRSNFQGTLNVLEAVRREHASAAISCSVLVVSSGEVYGSVPRAKLPIDESFPLHPENPYAITKACADMTAQQYRSLFGLDVVVVRPFNHLGQRQSDLFVGSAFARQIAEIKCGRRDAKLSVGNLEPQRDFTDVRDVVNAYIRLLERPRESGVFNVCSGKAVAIREILNELCDIAGVKVDITPDPKRLRGHDNPVIIGSALRLQKATGWAPSIPLRKTLEDLFHYWEGRVRSTT